MRHGASRPSGRVTLLLGAVGVVFAGLAVWAYLSRLDHSLWHDEAFTMMRFVERGPDVILFGQYGSNNHVLFSLLTWAAAGLAGGSEVVLRLSAVLPSLAGIAIVTAWLWRRFEPVSATLFLIVSVTSPVYFQLARVARGYGLGFLAGSLLVVFSERFIRDPRLVNALGLGAAGAIGVSVLPVFLLPYATALVVVVSSTREWRGVAFAAIGSSIVPLIMYGSRLNDLLQSSGQDFGEPLRWFEPATSWVFHFLAPSAQLILGNDPQANATGTYRPTGVISLGALYGAILAFLVALVVLAAFLHRFWSQRSLLWVTLSPLFGTYAIIMLFRFNLLGRFVSFLAPYVFVVVALGIGHVVFQLSARSQALLLLAGVGLAGVVSLMTFNYVAWARTWHDLPHENFKEAATVADEAGNEIIYTDSVTPTGLRYYLRDRLVVDDDPVCSLSQFTFIHHRFMNEPPDLVCLSDPDVKMTRFFQQGRGRILDVYVR